MCSSVSGLIALILNLESPYLITVSGGSKWPPVLIVSPSKVPWKRDKFSVLRGVKGSLLIIELGESLCS